MNWSILYYKKVQLIIWLIEKIRPSVFDTTHRSFATAERQSLKKRPNHSTHSPNTYIQDRQKIEGLVVQVGTLPQEIQHMQFCLQKIDREQFNETTLQEIMPDILLFSCFLLPALQSKTVRPTML